MAFSIRQVRNACLSHARDQTCQPTGRTQMTLLSPRNQLPVSGAPMVINQPQGSLVQLRKLSSLAMQMANTPHRFPSRCSILVATLMMETATCKMVQGNMDTQAILVIPHAKGGVSLPCKTTVGACAATHMLPSPSIAVSATTSVETIAQVMTSSAVLVGAMLFSGCRPLLLCQSLVRLQHTNCRAGSLRPFKCHKD